MKAYLLLRTSTDLQETSQQLSECTKYAERNNIEIVGKFETRESAYKNSYDERDDMLTIMDMARKGTIECLLCYKLDRLARQMNAISFFTTLLENKVAIHSAIEGEIKGSNTFEKLQIILKLFQAEGESENSSIRIKDKFRELNERGIYFANGIPYGFELEDTGIVRNFGKSTTQKNPIIDKEKSAIVIEIFNMYLYKNYGCTKIATTLNKRGIPSPKNKKWSSGTVHGILTNKCYCGFLRYNTQGFQSSSSKKRVMYDKSEWKYKPFPQLRLISDDDFNKVQKKLAEANVKGDGTKMTHSNTHLFSGMLKCGYCGKKLTASSTSHKRKDGSRAYNYHYICRNGSKNDDIGHLQRSWGISLEDALSSQIRQDIDKYIAFDVDVLEHIGESRESNILEIKRDLAKLDKQLEEQYEMLNGINEDIKLSFVGKSKFPQNVLVGLLEDTNKKIEALNVQKQELSDKLSTIDDSPKYNEIRKLLNSWSAIYDNASFEQKKMLLATIIDSIEVRKGKAMIHYKINQLLYANHRVNNTRLYGNHIRFTY